MYWECLASLEESRGDFKSAISYYERAVQHGAEVNIEPLHILHYLDHNIFVNNTFKWLIHYSSCKDHVEDLLQKISELNIGTASPKRVARQHENSLLDSSNIIKSSGIQFEVQEK